MHEKMHLNSNLPLEQLSTEELERLLRTPDGEEPDVDFIMKVMEVIQFREKQTPVTPQLDVDAAWQEFQDEYLDHTVYNTKENYRHIVGKAFEHTHKPIRIFRRVAIIAAAILLFIGTATAFGRNIFQGIAQWTSDTFHFSNYESTASNQAAMENDPYAELRDTVSTYTDAPVIPKWAPDGTKPYGEVQVLERHDCTSIKEWFQSTQGNFSIYIQIYDHSVELDDITYQKDSGEVRTAEAGGITHFLFSNLDTCGATWISGNVRCYIQGKMTMDDTSQMVDSIYEE